MRVAVIESNGIITTRGEWDGKRVDGEYARIGDQLYHVGWVFLAEHEGEISSALIKAEEQVKAAQDHQMKLLMEFGNKYRAR